MKLQIKWALFLFFVLSFEVCSGQFNQKKPIRRTDSLLNVYKQENAPGMAVAIIKDGKVIYKKTHGLANLEDKTPITDSTAFNIASVSKQFTGFMTLLAEQEGKLSLEDDIRIYLPELSHLPYKITVRQLANHTHGLPNFTEIKKLQGFGDEFKVTNNEGVHTLLGIKSINFPPGEQYQYNNTGFTLLAEILHRIYKKDFSQIVKEYIFDPLQMKNTMAIDNPDKIIPNKAESYQQKDNHFLKFPIGQMVVGSSNIYTTLDDLCKWACNFQNPIQGSHELYNKMQKNTVLSSGRSIEYGLGLQTEKYKGLDIVFHGGGTVGYRTYILHVPSKNFSVVTLINQQDFQGLLIAYQLVDFFLADQQILPVKPQKTVYTSSELKQFEGVYEFNPGNYLEVSAVGKDLYVGTYNKKGKELLEVIGDNKFKITSLPIARFTFHDGLINFRIADFTYFAKKIILNPPKVDRIRLNKLVGFYRNEEFDTTYQLLIENNKLVARHPMNGDIELYPLDSTSFYSTKEYFGQLDFNYGENNEITKFILSGANILNIEFKKIK
ncbi:serine hydrolase [Chryseobacterium sp. BIGb0232]|uniref:serine hydrolase domain-containing protein n=1 Tax=Chryseobacterium sp. BIGb0232 TaxID=2940598 RepID=UPI000F49C751|nr:serine hydrolase domain-containing protein [Chryseobacterium sp. BIGb0232]MCS4300734.1 CubicO group peptidase (beta-lactamase class C family) [Chryseobacterium sp. BIGb0232]ROS20386.1 CubicO group peptidase (beta-lactamase class C family) [Chryseobacterium nakagawai]